MEDILSKIVVTKTTLFLAVISVAAIIINYYASLEIIEFINNSMQNKEQNPQEVINTANSFQQYMLVTMPLLLISWFLPLFWAWQNYKVFKKKWLFVVAVLLIISSLHYLAGITVLLLYLKNFWQEFTAWRTKKIEIS